MMSDAESEDRASTVNDGEAFGKDAGVSDGGAFEEDAVDDGETDADLCDSMERRNSPAAAAAIGTASMHRQASGDCGRNRIR